MPPEFIPIEYQLSSSQTKQIERMDPDSSKSIENMVNLRSLSEASILHNLRLRFAENKIYTSVGSILVSVNPFRQLSMYTAELLDQYKENGHRNMPPHVYGVAGLAYTSLTENGSDQSCIVSGESGAGKTEATKIFLQFIAEVSSQAAKQNKLDNVESNEQKVSLQEQILQANPLMEAFGNAKTVRNDNSSRFGKWIEISFNNKKGTIVGGKILQYLLEKSRIVKQGGEERNYHIFYNLCAGAAMDSEVRRKFKLTEARDYDYLAKDKDPGILIVPTLNDEASFEDVLNSMQLLGISLLEQDNLLTVLAGILHLGNIQFVEKEGTHAEDSKVANTDMLEISAEQFGVQSSELEKALTTQKINISKDVTTRHLKVQQAKDTRDALAKALYASMFDWLIQRINTSFKMNSVSKDPKKEDKSIIGVLDIFGFEVFDFNSLEQLCINYCNEKLQFHFNNHIFKLEEAMYKKEGIDVSKIEFKDNIPTIELFEKKTIGIFAQMDEQMFLPHGSDKKFLDSICKVQKAHPNFKGKGVKTNHERFSFSVIHYAGRVMYNVANFLEKNSDKVSPDLTELIKGSKMGFITNLIASEKPDAASGKRVNRRKKGASLCSKFKVQLNELMNTLDRTDPQFIRCIKPNQEKVGGVFTSTLVLEQLRYAGLLEVCRIRKIGYPIRKDFKQFLYRYGCLVDDESPKLSSVQELCSYLLKLELLSKNDFQVGKTKVFLRGNQVDSLEARRESALKKYALTIQRVTRGWIERKKYRYYRSIISKLKEAISSRIVQKINHAIEEYGELPFAGVNRPEVQEARKLLRQMEENNRVLALLESAAEHKDKDLIESALQAASNVEIVSKFKEVEFEKQIANCKTVKAQLEEEEKAKLALTEAITQRNLQELTEALAKLNELGLDNGKEYQQGEIMKAKLEEAERLLQNIEQAVEEEDLETLKEALNAAEEIGGFDNDPRVMKGKEKKEELIEALQAERREEERKAELERTQAIKIKQEEKKAAIKAQLEEAVKNKDVSLLYELRAQAIENGLEDEEVDKLLAEVEQMEAFGKQVSALEAAMEGLRTLMLNRNGIDTEDFQYLNEVIDKAREIGMTEDNAALKEAVTLEAKASTQVEVQNALGEAIFNRNIPNLRAAIANADELNLDIDLLTNARELLKDERMNKPAEFDNRMSTKFVLVDDPELDEEEKEKENVRRRQQMFDEAQNPKYDFRKFFKIRSPGDYVRGMLFNKRKYIDSQLKYQTYGIPKSILALRKDLSKQAIGIYKSILGYCGEVSMQFPATLAQNVLEKGITTPELIDEIYVQLCKHITDNKKPESSNRAWQLMCMAVGTFSPSPEFEFYLINFLVTKRELGSLMGNYAQYSLRRLEGILARGSSGFLPSLDEILAYKQRPPVLATIETVDGTPITLDFPVPPDFDVDKVINICTHFLELGDSTKGLFGIYVQEENDGSDVEEALPESGYSAMRRGNLDIPPPPPLEDGVEKELYETPHPLRGTDFLGDVVVQAARKKKKYSLVFKKKLFLPDDNENSDNVRYKRMLYLQAADEVIRGNVLVENIDDFLLLTAIAIQLDLPEGRLFPVGEQQLLELDIMNYIPYTWSSKKTEKQWARAILPKRGKVIAIAKKDKDGSLLEKAYVDIVRKVPLWGFNFFFVREKVKGNDIICAVRYEGLSFFTPARKKIRAYAFHHIERWGGSSTQFWCLVWNEEKRANTKVSFYTKQARDISNLILDYTRLRQLQAQQVK